MSEDERRLARLVDSGEAEPELLRELEQRIETGRAKVAELAERGRQSAPRPPPADLQARLQHLERRRSVGRPDPHRAASELPRGTHTHHYILSPSTQNSHHTTSEGPLHEALTAQRLESLHTGRTRHSS